MIAAESVRVYRGVPYARPPLGPLRWRAPQPPTWMELTPGGPWAPDSHQLVRPDPGNSLIRTLFFNAQQPQSEDCLYLNIWTAAEPGAGQPVMVWIHGGGFRAGSPAAPLYDGTYLAQLGVTVVSVSYRLWRFGFFAHPALTAEAPEHASGNYGLLDVLAALRWVQSNITAFGGDPARVTIFGESAGGFAVSYLLASPLARGLFAGAIAESGAGFAARRGTMPGRPLISLAEAEAEGERFARALGVRTLDELRALPAQAIVDAPAPVRDVPVWPIVDGHVLPERIDDAFARGAQIDVPTIAGANADEATLFPLPRTRDAFIARAQADLGPRAAAFLRLYPATDDAIARASSEAAFNDAMTSWPNWIWAHAQARSGQTPHYAYQFARRPPVPDVAFAENEGARLGAYHGSELHYVFGNLVPETWAWTHEDQAVSAMMARYWVNFARTGDPNGPGLPPWTAFDPNAPQVLRIEQTASMAPFPRVERFGFWDDVAAAAR